MFDENSLQTFTQDAAPIVTGPTIQTVAVSISCIYSHQPHSNVLFTVKQETFGNCKHSETVMAF
jgi:hypothetical protein